MYDSRMSGASAEVNRNRNAAWPFGVATLGMLVPVLIAIANASELLAVDHPALERPGDFIDVDGRNEDVIAHGRQQSVRDEENRGLRFSRQCQYAVG